MTLLKRIGDLQRMKPPDVRPQVNHTGGLRCAKQGCQEPRLQSSFLCARHNREMLDKIRAGVLR